MYGPSWDSIFSSARSISRITIIVDSGNSVVEQVEKQLNKLVDVIKVRTLDDDKMIARELLIVVGDRGVIEYMVGNDKKQKRFSGLRWRLRNP